MFTLTRAAMPSGKAGSAQWFFSHNRCFRCSVFQEGDSAVCRIGIGSVRRGGKKGFRPITVYFRSCCLEVDFILVYDF